MRLPGWLSLLTCLIGAVGCATGAGSSSFRVEIPQLAAPPIQGNCRLDGNPVECVAVLKSDWENVIRALKAACLNNGQTPQECLTEDPAR